MQPKKIATLVTVYREHEDELRADLQQHYGIDLDHAMDGEHTPMHIAALVENLPQDSRVFVSEDKDMAWKLPDVLLASILNSLNGLIWGMGDARRRGKRPDLIGPTKLTEKGRKSLPARAMPITELMEQLERPRRGQDG